MHLTVVLDLFVALYLQHLAVLQFEAVDGVLQVCLFDQYALERLGVETEGGAALEVVLVGVEVDVLELLERVVGGDVGCLGDGGVDPLL